MRHTKVLHAGIALALILSAAGSCGRAESQIPGPDAPGPKSEMLARGASPDDITGRFRIKTGDVTKSIEIEDASEVAVVRNTFAPGASTGWHTHHGPAIVVIASGVFTYVRATDCARFTYKQGQSFVDPGHGNVHVGFNASDREVVVYATHLEVPKGESQTIKEEAPDC